MAVGVLVAVVSYLWAFFFLRGPYQSFTEAGTARLQLRSIAATVEAYREKEGHYPAKLTDIEGMKDAFKHDDDGRLVDRWEHPLQYSATADGFTLVSLGKDGEPGGEGEDADLHHDRPLAPPSFHHFTFELPTAPLRWTCLLTGLGAAVVVFRSRSHGRDLVFQAAATTGGALLIAFVLMILHIPSGH